MLRAGCRKKVAALPKLSIASVDWGYARIVHGRRAPLDLRRTISATLGPPRLPLHFLSPNPSQVILSRELSAVVDGTPEFIPS